MSHKPNNKFNLKAHSIIPIYQNNDLSLGLRELRGKTGVKKKIELRLPTLDDSEKVHQTGARTARNTLKQQIYEKQKDIHSTYSQRLILTHDTAQIDLSLWLDLTEYLIRYNKYEYSTKIFGRVFRNSQSHFKPHLNLQLDLDEIIHKGRNFKCESINI